MPRPNRRHFADDIFKCIFENENESISPRISLKFVPKVQINNIPALVQIMAWRRPGDKPLSEPMMVSLLTHICVTRPQWVISVHPRDQYTMGRYNRLNKNILFPRNNLDLEVTKTWTYSLWLHSPGIYFDWVKNGFLWYVCMNIWYVYSIHRWYIL